MLGACNAAIATCFACVLSFQAFLTASLSVSADLGCRAASSSSTAFSCSKTLLRTLTCSLYLFSSFSNIICEPSASGFVGNILYRCALQGSEADATDTKPYQWLDTAWINTVNRWVNRSNNQYCPIEVQSVRNTHTYARLYSWFCPLLDASSCRTQASTCSRRLTRCCMLKKML